MSSLLAVRLGSDLPTILHQPPGVVSHEDAEAAIELANSYLICNGHPLAPSQELTLRNALGTRKDRLWAATRVGDFGPRQGTGKNDKINARELAGLILFGEKLIIHTAHEFPTANEAFLRLVEVFENWDDLRRKVQHIYYANGAQAIHLRSGQRIIYKARTGGGGRGFAGAALIVYDEAQHLEVKHLAASAPTRLAAKNSQTWYSGSGGLATSSVAWRLRRDALGGTGGRLAYTEMTGEQVRLNGGQVESVRPEETDREVWYACMPGLGRWITEESVEALLADLGPGDFAREGLCVWDPEPGADGGLWPDAAWEDACSPHIRPEFDGAIFAVDVHPERTSAAVAVSDPAGRCELIEHHEGVGWVVEAFAGVPGATVALQGSGPAGALVADLERAGLKVVSLAASEVRDACGAFYDAVCARSPFVVQHPALDEAAKAVIRKASGDAWVFDRRKGGDVTPLYAAAIARKAALVSPPSSLSFVF